MEITIEQLLQKIGLLTMLMELNAAQAQAKIKELEDTIEKLKA